MACTNHPLTTAAVAPCTRCSLSFCDDCLVEMDGSPVCAACKAAALAQSVPPPRKPGIPEGSVPPWERASELGWWTAFWRTVSEVMVRPSAFFGTMEKKSATWTWLWIPAITHTGAAITNGVASLAVWGGLLHWLQSQGTGGGAPPGAMFGVQAFSSVLGIVIAPVIAILLTLAWAGCIHLWLMVFKKNKLPFAQTVRGVSYSYGAYVVALLPFVGQYIGAVWCSVVNYKMVRKVHGADGWTAFLAVTWFGLLCCSGIVLLYGGVAAYVFSQR